MTHANSQVSTMALELLPKFKIKKMKSRYAVEVCFMKISIKHKVKIENKIYY